MLNNKTIKEFIEYKQKLIDSNLNAEKQIQGRISPITFCLNGTCTHDKVINVKKTIKLNEENYSIELINLVDEDNIDVCLTCINILSPLNDILYFKTLLTPDELEEKI